MYPRPMESHLRSGEGALRTPAVPPSNYDQAVSTDRSIWLGVAAVLVAVAVASLGVAGTFAASREDYSFWSSTPMWFAYVLGAAACLSVVGAVRDWKFPGTKASDSPSVATLDPVPTGAGVSVQQIQSEPSRIFVTTTPKELSKLYEDHLTVNAAKLAEAYLGKWMEVEGRIRDINQTYGGRWVFLERGQDVGVSLKFADGRDWQAVLVMSRGQTIRVAGRIEVIDWGSVLLGDCELRG